MNVPLLSERSTVELRDWQRHLSGIIARVGHLLAEKYMRGQESHGGRLWRKPCLARAQDEILDLVVYFDVIREHVQMIQSIARDGLAGKVDPTLALTKIANICELGNPEGLAEEEK